MTKEEYKKAASVINKQILDLRKVYVESNSTITAGTKVQVCSNVGKEKEVGIILGYELRYNDILPVVAKMKKDGTAHKSARIFVLSSDTIEPIE